jgi:aminopeptidase N
MPDEPVHARDVLSAVEAAERAARVAGVDYTLALDLPAEGTTYRGEARLRFPVDREGDLFLDFRGGEIERLEVNGRAIHPERAHNRIHLPGDVLAADTDVRVVYENAYDRTGDGFHLFVDPEDGERYLYTNFEPFEAHRLIPAFDQPDIKGRFALTVTAPAAWEVLANSPGVVADAADGRRVHRFDRTPPISTYLAALVAGPFAGFHDAHAGVPLGLWCRRSLAPHLDPGELFTVTRQGFDFFTGLFARPYPFAKYDQVFVPEFNAGAMENVGLVTHSELMVYRDPPTDAQRMERAETVLHELAHMWFGDLVTMRWWDDLWLNESFATYVSFLAMAEATRFSAAWRSFHATKQWAIRIDEYPTTHPVRGPVPDTDATFYNFDGITYGKGAAVLKQLVAAIGMDAFRAGIRTYFDRHAWGNATLGDFMAALEAGSGRSLSEWAGAWLETASLNTLAARWDATDGRLTRLALDQVAPASHPVLRPHVTSVALVRHGPDGTPAIDVVPVALDGPSADVPAAAGRPAPLLVFPDHDDHAYAKVALDGVSLAALPALLPRLDDGLLRVQLWGALGQMVRDRELRSTAFLGLIRDLLPAEAEIEIVTAALDMAAGALARYVPEEARVGESSALVRRALATVGELPPGDCRIAWTRVAIAALADPADVSVLADVADGRRTIAGVQLDQDMRWGIVRAAVAHGLPGAEDRLGAERARDGTDRGAREALGASVGRPDAAVKAEAWLRINGGGYGSFHLDRAAMGGFRHAHQAALLAPYREGFFEAIPTVAGEREHPYVRAYIARLFPFDRPEPAVAARAREVIAVHGERLPTLDRQLREAVDDLERAMACRAFAAEVA